MKSLSRKMLAAVAATALIIPIRAPGRTPSGEIGLNVSWGDHIMVCRGPAALDTPEKIRAAMRCWKNDSGVTTVFWRVSALFLEQEFVFHKENHSRYPEVSGRIFARFDPVATAIREAHRAGMRILAYHTIFDEGSPPTVLYGGKTPFPWMSKFTIAHPEYLVTDRTGTKRQWGVMEYAYPEVRKYKIGQFRRLLERYPFDGVYVCTRSHSRPAEFADEFGFNDPIVRAFRKRYGIDIRNQPFDKEKWRRLRGEFLTRFFRELRLALPGKEILAAIPRGHYIGPPYGNMYLDWETWLRDGIVDGLVIGVISGKWLYPDQARSDREKGYLCSQEEGLGVGASVEENVTNVYGPVCSQYRRKLFVPCGSPEAAPALLQLKGVTGVMLSSLAGAVLGGRAFVPDRPALDLRDARFRLEFSLFLRAYTDWPRILSKYDHTLPRNAGRGWEVMLSPRGNVRLRVNDGRRDHTVTSRSRVALRRWTRIACVSEGPGGRMYIEIDENPDPADAPAPENVRPTPVPLVFGEYAGGGRRLNGMLDDVRVLHLVPGDAPKPRAEVIAFWNFDDANGSVFPDHGPTGKLTGRVRTGLATHPVFVEGAPGRGKALNITP